MDSKIGRLAGKTALITRAASGIGRAAAALFRAEAAKLVVIDRNEEGVAGAARDGALAFALDIVDEDRWRDVVDAAVSALGRLDILVNSGGGSIVGLSSAAGMIGDAQSAAHGASKGAVRLLTKSIAIHCARARYQIRCNSVHPAFTETPMVDSLIARSRDPARLRDGLSRAIPLGRMGRAEEVAAAILYLASDESSRQRRIVLHGGNRIGRRRRPNRPMTCNSRIEARRRSESCIAAPLIKIAQDDEPQTACSKICYIIYQSVK
jgi:3(or 17)beta-hydroxysteroid dehydrogenase